MRIRSAKSADFSRLAEIERAAGQLFPPGRVPDADATLAQQALATGVQSGWLRVGDMSEQLAGFTLREPHDGVTLHLLEVAVHPSFGRKGLGRALVADVLDRASDAGYGSVSLTTFRDLPFNGPFYKSMGFAEIADADLYPKLREILHAQTDVGMKQRIGMLRTL